MKTPQEFEKEIIDSLKEKSGKDLKAWLAALKAQNHAKRNEMMAWLKKDQGLLHSQANTIVSIHFNNGKPVYQDDASLMDAHFVKKEQWRSLYENLEKAILGMGPEIKMLVKKGYLSFNGKREFAVASIKAKEIRVGMDLGDRAMDDYVKKATSLGTMPRISHMVVITKPEDIDDRLMALLRQAYDHVHKK